MMNLGTKNVNNSITGMVASVSSTEKTTPKQTIDYAKRFKEFWPMLTMGFSFPMHDQIDHGLEPQSGRKNRRKNRYVKHQPPMYLFALWFFFCLTIYFSSFADKLMYWILFYASFYFKLAIVIDCFFLASKWGRNLFRPVLYPQMGSLQMDPYLREAIQVWCLFECLRDSKTKRGMIAAITQYLQAHVKESIPLYLYRQISKSKSITDWSSNEGQLRIEQMLEDTFSPEIEVDLDGVILDTQDGDLSKKLYSWHSAMDEAFTNWKDFRNSTVAKRFTHLVNVIVTAGMCSTANLTFKLGDVTLFTPIVSKKQLAASDVFEAFYEAVSGFMKGGWRVFHTGEVSSFFMEDDEISKFDSLYNAIQSWHGYALAGNLRSYTEIDENEYDSRIKKAIEFGETLMAKVKRSQTFERKYLSDRIDRMRNQDTEFTQLRTRGGLRITPFAVSLFGQSGCGKSCLTNLTINAGLIYNDLSAEKDRIATWADNDKFASAVRSHINAIIFDDFANTKEDFMDFSPAYRLIQVINNIRYLAPMADVFLKGKVSLNPYFCVVSTNVEHLNASKYSNEPESVLRRLYHVKVVPKKEYCENGILSKAKIEEAFGKTPCPDVWYLSVRVYQAQNKRYVDLSALKHVVFNGKTLENISVYEYLEWLQVASKEHFSKEGDYVANQEQMPNMCEKCNLVYCKCSRTVKKFVLEEGPPKKPTGEYRWTCTNVNCSMDHCSERDAIMCYRNSRKNPVLKPESGEWKTLGYYQNKANDIKQYYAQGKTQTMIAASSICSYWERIDFMPESVICHPTILKVCLIFWRTDLKQSLISGNVFIFLMMLVSMYGMPRLSIAFLFSAFVLMYLYTCSTVQTYQILVSNRILELKDVVSTYISSWQFKYAIIGLGAVSIILATLRSKHNSLEMHTGLNPDSIEEINERNDASNPWITAETVPLPMSVPSKTTTSYNLSAAMRTNLIGIVSDKDKTTLGFYISSNFILVPTHFLDEHGERDIDVRCYKSGENKVGSYFRDKLSVNYRVNIPTTDFSMCFVTGGGSMKDFRKFLPVGNVLKACPAKLITREIMDTSLRAIPTLFKGSTRVTHTKKVFMGSYYTLPVETKSGMCMSPLISDAKGSVIMGFHLGGKGTLGGCGTLTLDQVNFAISELATVDGVVLSASCGDLHPNMGDFPVKSYGHNILETTQIHPKSAVNFLTDGACIDVFGQTIGKATPHSNVCPTIISDAVEKVFGVPQKWGPPKMKGKGRYPYQATLVHAAIPSLPIGSILAKSVRTMKDLTTDLKLKIPELFQVAPLSRVATVSGLIGVKFIDPMNFNTSPGFPLTGNKHPLLLDLDPEEYPECGLPRTFKPEIWDEFDRIIDVLREGTRCYVIWKSCLKDEATKLTKDKVRVFQSAPLVLQLIVRMYFLPLVRIIQMNPILYECAVGVNAEGLEWEELWESAMSKGKDRVLAGDYSKYDVRMPAQVTIAAFDILIDIAKKCDDYRDEDIHLMNMVVNEVVYPIMAYNGDLIQLFGTNPSGQNLTVIINSLVNSLLLRSCFYTFYPQGDFKEACAFLTYGDDVIGTVSKEYPDFTHITYAEWLAKHDMKFTMPDKESTPTHYMKEEDVDFLKRKCAFNPDLGRKVGLLSEDSIYKRLHSHILSKELTLPMHSAQNIESSLHDWFYYGREIFEDRREKLCQVADECEIRHLCPALDVSYDKRVNHWKHKYLGEELEEENEPLEIQCGDLEPSTGYDLYDHCIGSVHVRHYWWEFYVLLSGLLFIPVLWALLVFEKIKFRWCAHFDKRWIFVLLFCTNGFNSLCVMHLFHNLFGLVFITYCLPLFIWLPPIVIKQIADMNSR